MQNLIAPHPSFMSQAWSLSVEEWFYLSFPLILVAVNLICPDQIRAYIYVALGFVCAAFLLRMEFYLTANTSWDEDVRKVVVFRLDSIAYGILTVYIWDQYNYFIKNNWRKIYAFSLMLASICIYELSKSMKIGDFENAFNYVFLFPITSIMICMVTLIFFEKVKTGGGFFSFVVRIVSQYSYSLYLSHFSVFLPIALYMQGSAEGWIVWLVYWGGSFLMSSLVFHFFESPIMGMRDRLARHALVRSE